ncbi:Zinc/iron permease, partial [Naviculisporaceae sp. PSN 640]
MEKFDDMATEPAWSSISTEFLLAELSRRDGAKAKPQCGSKEKGAYNMELHVFALFLVLVLSTGACAIPVITRRATKADNKKKNTILFYCQHFGTGVLLATAFVHLLPTAFMSLTDPCLSYIFSEGYRPLAGLVAMVSVFLVVAVESYLTTKGAGHSHSHDMFDESDSEEEFDSEQDSDGEASVREEGYGLTRGSIELEDNESSQRLVANASPLPQSAPSLARAETRKHQARREQSSKLFRRSRHAPGGEISEEERRKLELQCLLLEAGILFHSVFIGMSLSVATGPNFVVFLIAICFHQCFEGIALGGRIVGIQHPRSSWKPWFMVLAFGLTTPIGQAIGLYAHQLYDPLSQKGLLTVG